MVESRSSGWRFQNRAFLRIKMLIEGLCAAACLVAGLCMFCLIAFALANPTKEGPIKISRDAITILAGFFSLATGPIICLETLSLWLRQRETESYVRVRGRDVEIKIDEVRGEADNGTAVHARVIASWEYNGVQFREDVGVAPIGFTSIDSARRFLDKHVTGGWCILAVNPDNPKEAVLDGTDPRLIGVVCVSWTIALIFPIIFVGTSVKNKCYSNVIHAVRQWAAQ